MGSILTKLYIIDLIVQDNASFQDYWEEYNKMFAKVKTNADEYKVTSKMMKRLQKFCERLYNNILSGRLFQQYLDSLKEQLKVEFGEKLFKNKTFAEKYLEYIKWKIDHV